MSMPNTCQRTVLQNMSVLDLIIYFQFPGQSFWLIESLDQICKIMIQRMYFKFNIITSNNVPKLFIRQWAKMSTQVLKPSKRNILPKLTLRYPNTELRKFQANPSNYFNQYIFNNFIECNLARTETRKMLSNSIRKNFIKAFIKGT